MPTPLSVTLRASSQKMQSSVDWLWLLQLEADVATAARTLFRLTDSPEQAVLNVGGPLWTFYPFPMQFGDIVQAADGNVQSLSVTLSNVTRELIPYLFKGDGFMGRKANIYQVARSSLALVDGLPHEFKIVAAASDLANVTLTLAGPVDYRFLLPQEQLGRFCGNVYQDEVCAYRGPLTSCKFTLTDCAAHGDEMVARGYPRQHPARFNGFVALSRKTA